MSLAIAKGCSSSAPFSSYLLATLGSSLFFEINQKFAVDFFSSIDNDPKPFKASGIRRSISFVYSVKLFNNLEN